MSARERPIRGRGTPRNPGNRFESRAIVPDPDAAPAPEDDGPEPLPPTQFLSDRSRSIIATNESPDVGFDASINPYRGCEHGCAYCYARPYHEYLGYSAGLDFETKILVKHDAPALLRKALSARGWTPKTLGISGVTDPYQPVERRLRLTRACLEVLAEFRNPVAVITKNHLVTRDIDVLADLSAAGAAAVTISITTLDSALARVMEPRTSSPRRRLDAIAALSAAGIPAGVLVAPVVPGLTDHEVPAILAAAAEAGARYAGTILLRLPHGVKDLFGEWLEAHAPQRKEKVLSRLRAMRGGKLYESDFEVRGRGRGPFADELRTLFSLACKRHALATHAPPLETANFRRGGAQTELF